MLRQAQNDFTGKIAGFKVIARTKYLNRLFMMLQ